MSGLLLSTPIATARGILNDTGATKRYSDADLLQYANDALDQVMALVPALFYSTGELTCVPNTTLQVVAISDARSLVSIDRVKNGNVVTRVDMAALNNFHPGWRTEAPGVARHWMPVNDDPLRFHIYPQAPAAQVLEVSYVRIPGEFLATQDTELPTYLSDAIADYIVHRAESRNDESVNTNRAAQFLASFVQKLKG